MPSYIDTQALKDNKLSKAEYLRIQGVLLSKRGYSQQQIIGITGRSLSTIQNWITAYHRHGIDGLHTQPPTKPPRAILTKRQKDNIKAVITKKRPDEMGFIGKYWDISNLRSYVKERCHKEYESEESYRRLLHYCGFSYQRVEFVDKRRKPGSENEFKERLRKKLKKGSFTMSW